MEVKFVTIQELQEDLPAFFKQSTCWDGKWATPQAEQQYYMLSDLGPSPSKEILAKLVGEKVINYWTMITCGMCGGLVDRAVMIKNRYFLGEDERLVCFYFCLDCADGIFLTGLQG